MKLAILFCLGIVVLTSSISRTTSVSAIPAISSVREVPAVPAVSAVPAVPADPAFGFSCSVPSFNYDRNQPLDVTFAVVTDLHFGRTAFSPASHKKHVRLLNNVNGGGGVKWSTDAWLSPGTRGTNIASPIAVVQTGDLTHDGFGYWSEPFDYKNLWEQGSTSISIRYPVFLGLGNHDIDASAFLSASFSFLYLWERMGNCGSQGVNFDSNGKGYSWDWHDVHLIQLNKWVGDKGEGTNSNGKPDAMQWLSNDLSQHVGNSGRPVLVFQHFCMSGDAICTDNSWWTQAQRDMFCTMLQPYNVIGIFVGHK